MGTDRMIVDPPALREHLRFLQGLEQFAVEKLIPHLAIEGFDIAVLPRRARLNIEGLDRKRLQPVAQLPGDKLRPVV